MVPDRPLTKTRPHDLLRANGRLLAVWASGALAFLALIVGLQMAGVEAATLTRDAVGISEEPVHYGFISNLGLVGWGAAATVLGLTAAMLGHGPRARYLAWTAALLVVILLDDALLLHEVVLPEHAGLPESVVYALYWLLGAAWLAAFRRQILREDAVLLGLAGGALALSLVLDALDLVPLAVEDAPKYVGIVSLVAYAVREAQRRLRPALDE
jgi:hypothetical protein